MGGYFFYYFYFCNFSVSLRLLASGNLRRKKMNERMVVQSAQALPTHPSFPCAAVQSWYLAFCVCVFCHHCCSSFSSERTVFGFWILGWGLSWKKVELPLFMAGKCYWSLCGGVGRQWRALSLVSSLTLVSGMRRYLWGQVLKAIWFRWSFSAEKHLASRGSQEAGCGKSLGRMETERGLVILLFCL